MSGRPTPAEALEQRRKELEEVIEQLPITDWQKTGVKAAASALAKAFCISTLATFAKSQHKDGSA